MSQADTDNTIRASSDDGGAMDDNAYAHVCNIEKPLGRVQELGVGLLLIAETLEEPTAGAINAIVNTMLEQPEEIDKEFSYLFRFHHPNRDHFERNGWPGDKAE
jgi:hypothetical protein